MPASVAVKFKDLPESARSSLQSQYDVPLDDEQGVTVTLDPAPPKRPLREALDEFGENIRPEDVDELYAAIDEACEEAREELYQERLKAAGKGSRPDAVIGPFPGGARP